MSSTIKNSYNELIDVTTPFQRLVHLAFAGSCILLFISGFAFMFHSLNFIANFFGGHFITKYVHNFSGLVFAVSGLFEIAIWFKEGAIFNADDIKWLMKGGGYLWTLEGIPLQGRFNAGQKMYFVLKAATWALMSVTGIIIWFPYVFGRELIVFSYPLHALGVASLAGAVVVHGFLGSLGNPGTIQAMITGKCTRGWAQLQHGKWLKEYDEKHGR